MKESNKEWWKAQAKPMLYWALCMISALTLVGIGMLICA